MAGQDFGLIKIEENCTWSLNRLEILALNATGSTAVLQTLCMGFHEPLN